MKSTVCLFAKAPRVGMAKTRLAPTLGLVGAAALAEAFLQDALTSWQASELLVAHTGTWKPELWAALARHRCTPQGPGDLGQRMQRVLQLALKSCDAAIAVGTDIPGLGEDDAASALRALHDHDAVLGPARDGGFYLLALKQCPDGLLEGLPWSSSETLDATRERLTSQGMSVALLPERFDVDAGADLRDLHGHLQCNPGAMLNTRRFLASDANQSVSVVMPVLNEAARLGDALCELRKIPGLSQVVVADGGSCDESVAIAARHSGVDVVQCAPGRAGQMNAGAKRAFGGTLLFLHADARLPSDACAQIRQTLAIPGACGGAFRLQTDYDVLGRHRPWVAPFLRLADMRSRYTSLPYGDQAPFVRAATFHALGGFRDLPLFEDLEFAQRLGQRGRWGKTKGAVRVSGRRFQERPFYYLGLMNTFPLLYRLGVSPQRLAAFYHQTR